jgi:glycosyltransferase involved in cell wall biosynthesis
MMSNHTTKRVIVFKSELLRDSEVFIREQVRAYTRWNPVLVGFHPTGNLDLSGLQVDFLGGRNPSKWSRRTRKLLRELNIPAPGVVRRLKRWNASLLHIHFGIELVAMWPAARSLGVPVLTTLHGLDVNIDDETWSKEGIPGKFYPRRLVDIARAPSVYFVAVSDAIRKRAIDRGISASKIFTQYIGVDVARFTPGGLPILQRKQRILYVGRMVEKKGGNILIEAFANIRQNLPNAELVMVGDGPLLEEFKRLTQTLRLPVTFHGSLSSDKVKEQMDQARVLCLPSVTAQNGDAEGFGLVLLEAQACGIPVVTSALGGATEGIQDGITGFAFAEKDIAGLETALIRVLSDDTLAAALAREARAYVVSKFDIGRCTAALEDLYDRISGTPASTP